MSSLDVDALARDARGPLVDPDTLSPTGIANATMRLIDEPGFAQAAKRLAGEIEAMPGPSQTADQLEQLIATGSASGAPEPESQRPQMLE